jgi:hypothetical protein
LPGAGAGSWLRLLVQLRERLHAFLLADLILFDDAAKGLDLVGLPLHQVGVVLGLLVFLETSTPEVSYFKTYWSSWAWGIKSGRTYSLSTSS